MSMKSVSVLAKVAAMAVMIAVSAAVGEPWDCGATPETVTCVLDGNGTLTISGSGKMMNYSTQTRPWNEVIFSVIIEDGVTSIGSFAFYDCTYLTSITIPNSVTSIESYAFSGCTGLTSITIPNSVTSIENLVFQGCTGLTSIEIPNSVTSIGIGAFSGCTGLTSVTIPNSVIEISNGAFSGFKKLESITIRGTGAMVADYSIIFNDLIKNVTNIIIDDGITSIGDNAFAEMPITSIEIPSSVTTIGEYAFSNCGYLTEVTIPNSVTSIGYGAFSGCTGLTSVTIGNSVAFIASAAFQGCTDLTSIEIPNSVTSIGDGAFSGCTGLTSITIPNSVEEIGKWVFSGCTGLTTIEIPNSVTSIEEGAFAGCANLMSVTNLSIVPPAVGASAFQNLPSGVCLSIPEESIDLYKDAEGWSSFPCVNGKISVLTSDRNIPLSTPNHDAVVIAPVGMSAFEITVGPNPLRGSDGVVNIFVTGKRVDEGMLTVYDVSGNVIRKISIHDDVIGNNTGRRVVGSWDLKDGKGKVVSAGSYLLRGTVTTVDGKRERVSVVVGVR